MEDASNGAIDKAAEALAELAKQSSILEDSVKDNIKANKQAPRELAKVMDRLEKQGDALIVAQKKYRETLKQIQATQKAAERAAAGSRTAERKAKADALRAERAATRALKDQLSTLGISAQNAAGKIDALAAEAHANKATIQKVATDLSKPSAKLGKGLDMMHSKVQNSISGLGKFTAVVALAKKAVTELYGQSIRLANKGLVGSMAQMNISAMKLRMTAEEFEGLVSANRDVIALMGGGAQGIENFQSILNESSVGLEYLGKEGKKAAATIMAGFNRAGFGLMSSNADISKAYQDNIKGLNKQFKLFNGVFGDTAEQFTNLYEQQLKSEALQAKLLSGDSKGLALQMREVMVRTETLKLMGLNNEQIIAMSKRVDTLFNPKENRQGEALTERMSARQALMAGSNLVRGEDPQLAEKIAKFVQSGEAERYQQMSTEDKKKYQVQNAELFKSISKMDELITTQKDKTGGDYGSGSLKALLYTDRAKAAGREFSTMSEFGKDLNQAQAQGYDQSLEGRMKLAAKGFENVMSDVNGETTALGKAFGKLRDSVESVTALLNNPFTSALTAIGAALLFTSTTIRAAVAGAAESVMATAKMMAGSVTGLFKGLWAFIKKFPVLSSIFGGLEGAYEAYNTDTEEYYKRTGIDRDATVVPQVLKDLGVRTLGALSDVGSSTMKALTFGMYDRSKDFADKQDKANATAGMTVPSATKLPHAATAGTNSQIAKVLSTSPGSNTVQRPDGSIETVKGDRNWRNNNPGNIEYGEFAQRMGAIGSDGRFAIFPDYETGRKAKAGLIFEGKNYKDLNLTDAIARYAPPSENNTRSYQASVLSSVGGQNKRMSDYSEDERRKILDAMQKVEGFKAGKITKVGEGQPMALATPPFAPPGTTVPLTTPQAPQADTALAAMSEVERRKALVAQAGSAPKAANPSNAPQSSGSNTVVDELKQHTGLLATMVTLLGKTEASKRGYQMDQQTGMSVAT